MTSLSGQLHTAQKRNITTLRVGLWERRDLEPERTDSGVYHGPGQEDSGMQPIMIFLHGEGASTSENRRPSLPSL